MRNIQFKILKIIELWLILTIAIVLYTCKNDVKSQLVNWESKYKGQSPNSTIMDELARICFHHSYRESKWDPESKTLFIEYGGSSALTFSDSDQYVPMTQLDLALKSSRTYSYGSRLGMENLRVSLVKPFYIKNSPNKDTEIQEFEVYRIQINPNIWDRLPSKELLNLFEVINNDYPQGHYLKSLEWLIQNWTEELNEFSRIEVR